MESAAAAKKAQLEKWRANAIDVNDPTVREATEARLAAAAARSERDRLRKAERDGAKAQLLADRKAAQEAAAAEAARALAATEAAAAEAVVSRQMLAEQQKAQRDARYAARKARK
jgi:hypothetical protein